MSFAKMLNGIDADSAERLISKASIALNLALLGLALVAVGISVGKPRS